MLRLATLLALCACGLAIPFAAPDHPDWTNFKSQHGKKYSSLKEEHMRFNTFLKTKSDVDKHNEEFKEGKHTYFMNINHMSDWTDDEFEVLLGLMPETEDHKEKREKAQNMLQWQPVEGPAEIDWREKGAIQPVQQQGHCGSCWTFAAAATLEGRYFIKTGRKVKLSEQNLLDCTSMREGCQGGYPKDAFDYIARNGGIDSEQSYPYYGQKYWCMYNPQNRVATDLGHQQAGYGEAGLKAAVASGPVAVGVDARTWKSYGGGVYNCPWTQQLNHAVTVVGYGQDYFLVKNSWGTSWGENGYIKVGTSMSGDNCGIDRDGSYPVV